ncbi:hypothetical protein SEA_DIMINIMUS_42 [Mycobacterium phage Diminimus]|uniref:Uncharacterized protein n=1 Tax=Mycobacterium phage Bricole TaxID=1718601 RepID=A0A0M4RQW0_9CAUD|nr:hypothetical protein SEA_BRICOLE_41 [Mycobacterium phage Bricole]QUU29241.1 hypothetical protein [Mycobacterium phage SirSheldon]WMI33222.1 hypothetical protein SEA_SLIMJIMMY_40 [Mycobacterium phage SlimJimmy]WNM75255.1 hypothetical protein SEA_AUSPICE_41 [Mycobacterium phage Auspice]WNN95624.1 hypothetical protein SEA_GLASKE16_42 [Mycobacterium phage Glaske16]WNN96202.1 hypothetical protein SEA_DULCITA_42 [Mycobacterium phage Dulcita]WNO28145.1 hypothetical protein SEA_DIMINIMUS_42 [Mycob
MSEKDPREGNLPKWAQSLLAKERYRADKAEHRLKEHLQTVEPSPIWYGDWENKIYIPVDYGYQTVYFSATGKPSKHTYEEIGVSFRKGVIQIQGGTSIAIRPKSSNYAEIYLSD